MRLRCKHRKATENKPLQLIKGNGMAVAMETIKGLLLSMVLLTSLAPTQAYSASAIRDEAASYKVRVYAINLPAQSIADSLASLSEQFDTMLLFPYQTASHLQANPVNGNFTLPQALALALKDTGFSGRLTQKGVLMISREGSENTNHKGRVKERKDMNVNHKTKKSLLAGMIGLLAAGGTAAVQAQDGENARSQSVLGEVIVTAQKREASMQEVPIAISAFTGDQLKKSGIESTLELEMVTPGLSFSAPDFARIFIRGVGSSFSGPGQDPSSSIYVNGVYQSRFVSTLFDMVDVERVEVLKGPQGTLYGRNSTGGAIKYATKAPGNEFGGEVDITVGNYDLRKIAVQADIPLIEDKLLFRGAVMKMDRDGYTENIVNPAFDADRDDIAAGHLTLQYLPSNDLDITLHATISNDDGDYAAIKQFIPIDEADRGIINAGAAIIDDPRKVASNYGPSENPVKTRQFDVTVKYDLGWAGLTSTTAYNDVTMPPWVLDVDGTEQPRLQQGRVDADGLSGDAQMYTQEFVLASQGDSSLDWLVGAFYLTEENFWVSGFDVAPFSLFARNRAVNKTDAYALFGHISYQLTDQLSLSGGLRFSRETKKYTVRNENNFVIGPTNVKERTWDDWTPKVSIDYSISDDVMVYASASQGFKSGGFNLSEGPAVNPENVTAYEIGAKTEWLDGRLRVNVSAFDYDYKDLQVQSFDLTVGTTQLNNAAEAEIKGLEVQSNILISDNFKVDLGLAWLDAEYTDFLTTENNQVINVSGNKLTQSPEFTASMGFEYRQEMTSIGEIFARLDYYYSTEKYFNEFNRHSQDDYDLVNARLGLINGSWEISAFGKNLTDELVLLEIFDNAFFYGEGIYTKLAPPRTYGLQVTYNF